MASMGFFLGAVTRLVQSDMGVNRGEGLVPNATIGFIYAAIVTVLGVVFSVPLIVSDLGMGLAGLGFVIAAAFGEFILFMLGSLSIDFVEFLIEMSE